MDSDWLAPAPEPPTETLASSAAPSRWQPAWLKAGALVVAGAIVGGGVALAVGHDSSNASASTATASGPAAGSLPGPPNGATGQFGGQFPDGGGLAGEQHIQGTLSAVGSSTVTVHTSAGTQTYQVTNTSEIVKNGARATLSQLKPGETVLVHVYPSASGNQLLVERLFAGSLPTRGGGLGPPTGSGPGGVART